MKLSVRRALLFFTGFALLLVACEDDGGGGSTPTPEVPHAAPVPLEDNVTNLGERVVEVSIRPGEAYSFDNNQRAQDLGITPPPCAAFVFAMSWQVRDPYPPEGAGAALTVHATRMEQRDLLGDGSSGRANMGCAFIEFSNVSPVAFKIEIRYAFGEFGG